MVPQTSSPGAAALEYGLTAALVSGAILGALVTLGIELAGVFDSVGGALESSAPADGGSGDTTDNEGGLTGGAACVSSNCPTRSRPGL